MALGLLAPLLGRQGWRPAEDLLQWRQARGEKVAVNQNITVMAW